MRFIVPVFCLLASIVSAACAPSLHDPEEFAGPPTLLAAEGVDVRVHTDFAPQPLAPLWDGNCINPAALPLLIACDWVDPNQVRNSGNGELVNLSNDTSCGGDVVNFVTDEGKGPFEVALSSIDKHNDTTFEAHASIEGRPGFLTFRQCYLSRK